MTDYGHPITFGLSLYPSVSTLTDWSVDLGLDTFIFWPMTQPLAQLDVFAREVIPTVRQRVNERRGQP
jgi:hypothetical protein